MESWTLDQIFELVGIISASSFVIVAVLDFLKASTDIVVQRLYGEQKTATDRKIVLYWSLCKDVYEEFRKFLDKLSAYSRPRKGGPQNDPADGI